MRDVFRDEEELADAEFGVVLHVDGEAGVDVQDFDVAARVGQAAEH